MSVAQRMAGAAVDRLGSTPEARVRALFGDPPRNDRGIELDLPTHALLRLLALTKRGRLDQLDPERARFVARRDGALADLPVAPLADQRDVTLGTLPARVYVPHAARRAAEPRPILVWLHGGGFVIGGLATHRGMCSNLAARSACVVVAIDYRKAPEHKFPAAVDDALAGFRWVRDHAASFGGRAELVAIGGDSAGGNLSAVVCQQLRERGEPQPALQVLIYPATDSTHACASHQTYRSGYLLDANLLAWFTRHYLRDPDDQHDPRASPLFAARFDGLAPAIVRTAGFDPLRDEGQAYADALRQAGVEVDYRCYERLIHNYVVMGRIGPGNRAAVEDLGDELRRYFAPRSP